jgi:hypothetical protein
MSVSSSISTSEHDTTVETALKEAVFRRWFTLAVATALTMVTACAWINWTVDPFDRIGLNKWGVYSSAETTAKPQLIRTYAHDGLIMGSSRVTYINPQEIEGYWLFNAGFSAAMPEEILSFLRLFGVDQKLVVIGLDFFMFNEREYPLRLQTFDFVATLDSEQSRRDGETLIKDWRALRDYLISRDVLASSIRTAILRMAPGTPQPYLEPAGNRNAAKAFARDAQAKQLEYDDTLNYWRLHTLYQFQYSLARVEILRDIRRFLDQRHIPYLVFINPENTYLMDLIKEVGLYQVDLRFRRDVAEIFENAVDLSESHWAETKNYFRADPGHYYPKIGAKMLNEMIRARADLKAPRH